MDDIIVEPIFPIKLFDNLEKFNFIDYYLEYSNLIKRKDNKREIDNYNNIVIKAYNSLLSVNKELELFDDIEFTKYVLELTLKPDEIDKNKSIEQLYVEYYQYIDNINKFLRTLKIAQIKSLIDIYIDIDILKKINVLFQEILEDFDIIKKKINNVINNEIKNLKEKIEKEIEKYKNEIIEINQSISISMVSLIKRIPILQNEDINEKIISNLKSSLHDKHPIKIDIKTDNENKKKIKKIQDKINENEKDLKLINIMEEYLKGITKGGNKQILKYIKYLNKYDLNKLRIIANNKKIKITLKLTKEQIINKLVKFKLS